MFASLFDELLLQNTSDKFVCKRSNLLKRRLLEQSLFTSTTSAFFERPREFRVPCRIRGERNARKKHAIFVRRYECRQTKLHEITFSRCTLLGPGTKEHVRVEVRSRKGASGKRKPIFVRVLSSVKGWTTRDFRRWARSIFGERGGFLPTAIASRRLEKCRPGKATSRWGAFFVNVTFSIVRDRRDISRRFYKSAVWNCIHKLNYVRKFSDMRIPRGKPLTKIVYTNVMSTLVMSIGHY